jgi:hypothetical protein
MNRAFIIAALVCFLLATFGVMLPMVSLVPLGLALYMISHLIP